MASLFQQQVHAQRLATHPTPKYRKCAGPCARSWEAPLAIPTPQEAPDV